MVLLEFERCNTSIITYMFFFMGAHNRVLYPKRCYYSHSFIHSDYFHSASLSPLGLLGLFRSAPDSALILYRSFTSKRHRQLRVKDLPKVQT